MTKTIIIGNHLTNDLYYAYWNKVLKFLIICLLTLLNIGCVQTSKFQNLPLSEKSKNLTIPKRLEKKGHNDEVTIILTFSGGGTRAAAFSYGVMEGLSNIDINLSDSKTVNMLSMVDVISSVSGGSFTSAYYGLFGNRLFTDFKTDFLNAKIQSQITRRLFINPINWLHFMSGNYNRSDLIANYLQKHIFEDKTFAEFRDDSPNIMINATDISTGAGFTFSDDHFRWLCSDLSSYPVGRAVTASSAVPVVFSPVLIKNRSGCKPFEYQLHPLSKSSQYKDNVLLIRRFQDKNLYPYLHLVDGGVADNLGIRAILDNVHQQNNNFWDALKAYRLTNTKKVLFITVNSSVSLANEISQSPKTPSLSQTLNAVTTIQSQNYNVDTLNLLKSNIPKWSEQVKKGRCAEFFTTDCAEFDMYMTELNFRQLGEPDFTILSSIETSLQLPNAEVDLLINAGNKLIKESEVIKQFIKNLEIK